MRRIRTRSGSSCGSSRCSCADRDHAIAEVLTAESIPCPSAYDRARNRHRCGPAWAKSAVRAILKNPRYTGHQVWNRQRKVEMLLDVNDVTLGHTTKLVWNDPADWVWSDQPVHEPLVGRDDFDRAQTLMDDPKRPVKKRARRTTHIYVLQGRFTCTLCTRKMEGNWSNDQAYYRCHYPAEYARTNNINHPLQVYVREADVLPALDKWLARAFAPHRFEETISLMLAAQGGDPGADAEITRARAKIAECDRKIAGYQAVLDAGGDPTTVAGWTRQATAERATAQAIVDAWRPQRAGPNLAAARVPRETRRPRRRRPDSGTGRVRKSCTGSSASSSRTQKSPHRDRRD
ncbi:recombinase family protein [Yinghuangia aomiensis]